VSNWTQASHASFNRTQLTRWQGFVHAVLSGRGVIDAIVVALRDPDVFLLQVLLWKGGGLKGTYQFRRLRELSSLLRGRDVSVLEFGSGASSLLIAKHARRAVTIEEGESWRAKLCDTIRAARWIERDLRDKAVRQIRTCTRREWIDERGEWVCGYELDRETISFRWDIAYIDGPTNWPQAQSLQGPTPETEASPLAAFPELRADLECDHHAAGEARIANLPPEAQGSSLLMSTADVAPLPNADVLELDELPGEIWVDGRLTTLRYLSRSLPLNWEVLSEMTLPRASRRLFHTRFRPS
jgi:hypothetical protein